jgi:hypothetical protein
VKAKLEKTLAASIADPDTRAKLLGQGLEPAFSQRRRVERTHQPRTASDARRCGAREHHRRLMNAHEQHIPTAAGTELVEKSAVELRRLIGSKAISPVDLLEACIARIERVNPFVNAVTATCVRARARRSRAAERP